MTEQLVRIDAVLLDRRIANTIKALAVGRGLSIGDVWEALGISRSAWYERAKGQSRFTAAEVAAAAKLLDVDISDLYSGMNGLLDGPKGSPDSSGVTRRYLGVIRGVLPQSAASFVTPATAHGKHLKVA